MTILSLCHLKVGQLWVLIAYCLFIQMTLFPLHIGLVLAKNLTPQHLDLLFHFSPLRLRCLQDHLMVSFLQFAIMEYLHFQVFQFLQVELFRQSQVRFMQYPIQKQGFCFLREMGFVHCLRCFQ